MSSKGRDGDDNQSRQSGNESEGGDREWSRFSRRIEGVLPDMMKRAAASGVKSFLQTEEGLRSLLGAIVPREVFTSVSDQLERSKSEAVRLISKEFREFLEKIDLANEIQRALTLVSIEVKTEIRFVPNDRAVVRPSVRSKARVKTQRDRDAGADAEADSTEEGSN